MILHKVLLVFFGAMNDEHSDPKTEDHMKKANNSNKQILGFLLLASAAISIIVCVMIDMAISGTFTWSLYPIVSVIFASSLLRPIIQNGKNGIVATLRILTVGIVPYLYVLDQIAGTETIITKAGGIIAGLVLIYLWIAYFIAKHSRRRKLLSFGITMILAVPLCILINYSLSLTLTPKAAAFDVWDVLSIGILLSVGAVLIISDVILRRKEISEDASYGNCKRSRI